MIRKIEKRWAGKCDCKPWNDRSKVKQWLRKQLIRDGE